MGLRYRVQMAVPSAPRRTIDIAFPGARVAVFVDGCFWHACPEHGTRPRSNAAWWDAKLARNQDRDRDTGRLLDEAGWTVVRFWGHEDPVQAAERVADVVRAGSNRSARLPQKVVRPP